MPASQNARLTSIRLTARGRNESLGQLATRWRERFTSAWIRDEAKVAD